MSHFIRSVISHLSRSSSSRGIDIPNIDCVILYDLPKNIRSYTHRIGRTARAGKIGRAITLVERERLTMFRTTIKSHRRNKLKILQVKKDDYASMFDVYQRALEDFALREQKKINQRSR